MNSRMDMDPRDIPGIHLKQVRDADGNESFQYVKTVSGGPLEKEKKLSLEAATQLYALCRNRLEAGPLIAELADNIELHAQDQSEALVGKDEVSNYLRGRFEFLRDRGESHGYVELGEIGLLEASDYPVAIFCDAIGERQSVAVLKLDGDGKIQQISFLMAAPPPSEAISLGIVPR